ncbi:MAG: epoxyqueuosine reductase QueH [Candidatus Latescibacteria bacterium]|nr:epoxyqueuosine reductase QueH [Candidatus Latescibacterota bacterium]
MPTLLLHICCGPCATVVLERLGNDYDITGYFFNPNIYPADEYRRRLDAAHEVARRFGIELVEGEYDPGLFLDAVRGLENEPENGRRCPVCYGLRLAETARLASARSFEALASTLTVGPMKKAAVIDPIGEAEAARAGVGWVGGDWKKRDGFRRSCELSKDFGLYRQHYCGCRFSMRGE